MQLSTLFFLGKNSGGLAVHFTFDEIQGLSITDSSTLGIHGKLVGEFAQSEFSPMCQKGIQLGEGLGYIELDGNKLDSEKKDAMSISLWIRAIDNDRVNTIYGSLGAKGVHHLSIKSTGSPNAVVHWLYKSPGGKVIFEVSTEPAVPAGQRNTSLHPFKACLTIEQHLDISNYSPSNLFARARLVQARHVTEYSPLKLGNIRD